MMIFDAIDKLNLFIVLNPFIAMYIFIVIGIYIDRLYLALNPNYELWRRKYVADK